MTPKLYKAGEVCDATGLQPYVLRSWEREFPGIGVQKSPDAPRLYRQSDVEQVRIWVGAIAPPAVERAALRLVPHDVEGLALQQRGGLRLIAVGQLECSPNEVDFHLGEHRHENAAVDAAR